MIPPIWLVSGFRFIQPTIFQDDYRLCVLFVEAVLDWNQVEEYIIGYHGVVLNPPPSPPAPPQSFLLCSPPPPPPPRVREKRMHVTIFRYFMRFKINSAHA